MWIVALALRRPYTFVVVALLLLILGPIVIFRTPTDIFPNINIPVVSILWNYAGLNSQDMSNRIVSLTERILTTTVDNIEHSESQSLNGIAVVKVFFQPNTNIERAIAQITAVSQTQLRQLPPGTTPPLIITYNASTVPVLQLALSGQKLSEQQLFDYGVNFIRTRLVTIPGVAIPYPYGGKQRQVQVDLDTNALQAKGLSPMDVVNAISAQNLILPSGTSKIGQFEYDVDLNGSPQTVAELNDLPIKRVGNTTIYVRDVAFVRDGFPPQTNIVRVDGQRASLLTIQKTGAASTLDIISGIKGMLPRIEAQLPPELQIKPLADQSLFVRASIDGVLKEGLIAACLTGIMILIFLGSWRSTVIIAVSIPLSILTSIIVMSALGETINIMTLGGLALAVGILVDDATVEIENINRNIAEGKEIQKAILDGAQQIAVPAFVSTLAICIVFLPMFFLTGVARYLFVPLAEAVVFAMLASYLLSRTLVPTMAKYLLRGHEQEAGHLNTTSRNPLVRLQVTFEQAFERFRDTYHEALERCLHHRAAFLWGFVIVCIASFVALVPWLGRDFFPKVDAGQFKLHLRARAGTRIEETASLCDRIEAFVRQQIPASEISSVIDNIGLPYSSINLSYSNSAPTGPADADILVTLTKDHRPTEGYVHDLRLKLAEQFPGVDFSFLPADIVSQILNFGLPSPIDVQVTGYDLQANRIFANKLLRRMKMVSGTADLRIQQPFDEPYLHIDVDRTKAQLAGFTQRDIATNLLISLSGSFQTSPTYWLNPKNGVSYSITTQTPQYRLDSLQDLENIPITGSSGAPPAILGSLASIRRGPGMALVSHYDIQPVIDIYGSVQGRDLGGVADDIQKIIKDSRKELPRGSEMVVRGQVQTMKSSYSGLISGLAFAILLVYLLIVVNFQSWLDPFIIISALPAALAGIVWMLFVSHTNVSVPALTGSIMCMGVATANSILVVSFAKEQMQEGKDAVSAALAAGFTRFRPVLMTALAMIIGMVPMAIGLGEGGEQNAPLGRAVIGGLIFATAATLFFVPVFFSLLHGRREQAGQVEG
ncbi:MAG: efflux RND transporter permease subunit [Terriglobales bacterium]|jgi:CzcA family heavy metal efflux pump|nr:efflux RND transporter permease subunit [Terriglobales bacterium]